MRHFSRGAAAAAATALLLTACGGGGGSSSAGIGSVGGSQSYALQSAWANYLNTGGTRTYTIGGTQNGQTVTGTGSETDGLVTAGTFEGVVGLQKTTTTTENLVVNGVPAPSTDTSTIHFSTTYVPLGSTGGGLYSVVTNAPALPASVRVGDSGVVLVENVYADATKATLYGTNTMTYAVLADSGSTALLRLTEVGRDTANAVVGTATTTFRMTPAGALTPLGQTFTSATTTLTITY